MKLTRSGFLAVAVFLSVLELGADAGTVSYSFVDYPAFQTDGVTTYHVSGSITVNDNAILAGTLSSADVTSYTLTISHGSITDFVFTDVSALLLNNVAITSTSVYLATPAPDEVSFLQISTPQVLYQQAIDNAYTSPPPDPASDNFQLITSQTLYYTHLTPPHTFEPFVVATNDSSPTPAVVPEPSTLVMSSIMFGTFGVFWSNKRMKQTAAA